MLQKGSYFFIIDVALQVPRTTIITENVTNRQYLANPFIEYFLFHFFLFSFKYIQQPIISTFQISMNLRKNEINKN